MTNEKPITKEESMNDLTWQELEKRGLTHKEAISSLNRNNDTELIKGYLNREGGNLSPDEIEEFVNSAKYFHDEWRVAFKLRGKNIVIDQRGHSESIGKGLDRYLITATVDGQPTSKAVAMALEKRYFLAGMKSTELLHAQNQSTERVKSERADWQKAEDARRVDETARAETISGDAAAQDLL